MGLYSAANSIAAADKRRMDSIECHWLGQCRFVLKARFFGQTLAEPVAHFLSNLLNVWH